jgi:hypothetical protein
MVKISVISKYQLQLSQNELNVLYEVLMDGKYSTHPLIENITRCLVDYYEEEEVENLPF